MDEKTNSISISFDPQDPEHLEVVKSMIYYNNAKLALWEFKNRLYTAMNDGKFPINCINRVDEEWRPTMAEVCRSADAILNSLNECFEENNAEEFLRD